MTKIMCTSVRSKRVGFFLLAMLALPVAIMGFSVERPSPLQLMAISSLVSFFLALLASLRCHYLLKIHNLEKRLNREKD